MREVKKAVPKEPNIHRIVDHYATHRHPKVKVWLASRPRWHLHFIHTYSSWLNQVIRFFALITARSSATARSPASSSLCSALTTSSRRTTRTANRLSGRYRECNPRGALSTLLTYQRDRTQAIRF